MFNELLKTKYIPLEFDLESPRQLSAKISGKSLVLLFLSTCLVLILKNPLYTSMYVGAVASTIYFWLLHVLEPKIGKHRWSIPVFHTLLLALVTQPVLAQANGVTDNANACNGNGLFVAVTNFVNTTFSTITFGGVGGGSLSNLICQVIGFMIVMLLLAFIGTIGRVAYQLSYEQQPLSAVINPLFGFLVFAGGVTVMITVMLGTSTSTS